MKHLKLSCIGCERSKLELATKGIKFNKEHLTPVWLVKRTGTDKTSVRWLGKDVPGLKVTIPLCQECNTLFGKKLERPMVEIFDELETDHGISDYQAELLVRWMWKFEGIHWHLRNTSAKYTGKYTLRERVTGDIDSIRPLITLSIARLGSIDPSHGDKPMGIDSTTAKSAIFVSGVFSELAIMVSHRRFDSFIPPQFSKYHLTAKINKKKRVKVFKPAIGFADDNDTVFCTYNASQILSRLHDEWQRSLERK